MSFKCRSEFQTSNLTTDQLSDLLCPDLSLRLPDSLWDTVWIDGGKCKGCFTTKRIVVKNDFNSEGDETAFLKCFLDVPKCGCNCRVICGSQVSFDGKKIWEVVEEEVTRHPHCTRWEIIEADCDEC